MKVLYCFFDPLRQEALMSLAATSENLYPG